MQKFKIKASVTFYARDAMNRIEIKQKSA